MYTLKNQNGATKTVKDGFSWTTFFFGAFVPLLRGDWKWFLIMMVASAVSGFLIPFVGPSIVGIAFSFFYNKLYLTDLLNKGYEII